MPYYCHQVSYTKEAWARLMADPQDRLDIVRLPIEKLGGKLHSAFFAFGPFDVIAITDMPDNMSAAAIAIAFAAGGAVSHIQTTPLDDRCASHRGHAQSRHLRLQVYRLRNRGCRRRRVVAPKRLLENPQRAQVGRDPSFLTKEGLVCLFPFRC